jgi:hypothetical protein
MLALTLALAAPAFAVDLPDPPATQSINPHDGPRARQRLKLLRNLFGPEASSVPRACHFALVGTPENPAPPYRARNLALVCVTGGVWGGGGVSTLGWTDGAQPDGNVRTTED